MVGLLVAAGCGSSASSSAPLPNSGGAGNIPGSEPTSLAFSPTSTLTVQPGQTSSLEVVAQPPAVYDIRFALLGDPKDASLDRSELMTSHSGVATVRLTAPTSATTFTVRASIGTALSAQAAVSVSAGGFGTLKVTPSYSGKRAVTEWTASVHAGTSCAKLSGTPPPDGDLVATASPGQDLILQNVPIGPTLAVTARAGSYAGGCADVTQWPADSQTSVVVPVTDRPIQLGATDLDVTLGVDPDASGWNNAVNAAIGDSARAMLGGDSDDVSALLTAMWTSTSDRTTADAFQVARTAGSWDQALLTALGTAEAPTAIRSRAKAWMTQGAAGLRGDSVFAAHLTPAPFQDQAFLELTNVAGLDAADGGVTTTQVASWTADAGDTVLLGATVFWMPSETLTALALKPALADQPTASTVPDALAAALSCQKVAQTLEQTSGVPGLVFPSCGTSCAESLCEQGLKLMWQRAEDASAVSGGWAALTISASAQATVDQQARPASFDGSWVGQLALSSGSVSVSGPARGQAPQVP